MKLSAARAGSRRQFLGQAAMLAGSAFVLAPDAYVQAETSPVRRVLDTHIHLYDPTKPGGVPWPPPADSMLYSPHLPPRFRAVTKGLGVAGAIVIEAEARPEDNQWVFDLAKTEPLILGYVARLSPGQPDFAEHFERYCQNPVFRGLRLTESMLLGGLGQAAFEQDLERMAERQLTVDLIGGTALLPAGARLARRMPGLQLVIDHLPFQNWDGQPEAMRSAVQDLAGRPNVYAKVSNVGRRKGGQLVTETGFYQPGLDALRELFGNDRVLYGSNWPVSDRVAPYDQMFQIVQDYFKRQAPGVAEKFFWKNSQAAYRWT